MRGLLLAGVLTGLLPSAAKGQEEADSIVLHHIFTPTTPTAHVAFRRNVVYRAELRGSGLGLRIRALAAHGRNPFTGLIGTLPGDEPGGVYQIYGADSGAYEASLTTVTGATSLDIYLDRKLSAERLARANRPRWTIGLEVSAGAHGGYQIGSTYISTGPSGDRIPTDTDDGGTAIEGCLSIRSGRRFSGCLGFEHQSRPGDDMSVDWFFIEPRFAAYQSQGTHPVEAGVSMRLAQGSQGTDVAVDPSMLAPGLFVAYDLHRRPTGQGLSLRASGYYAWLGNTNTTGDKPTTFRLAAGVNWHP